MKLKKMNPLKIIPIQDFILLILFVFISNVILAQPLNKYIDPFIGSVAKGNVFVGPSAPFGMVKPGPDCGLGRNSGYDPDLQKPILGFSQVHVSGTGGGPKYGNISFMPFDGEFSSISKESLRNNEKTLAGFYSVNLSKWNIDVELTTSDRVAFHKYTYKNKAQHGLKIDAGFFLGERSIPDSREAQQFVGSEIEIISDTEVQGYSRIRGGWNNGKAYTVYFYAIFNKAFSASGTWLQDSIYSNIKTQCDLGKKTGAYFLFSDKENEVILTKVGISFLSIQKAKLNVDQEISHWDFGKELSETQNKWEELLSKIDITASEDQKKMFYTALYHTMLMPVDRTGENPLWTSPNPYYDDFYAIWDTFRSSHPLITLIDPARQADIVKAMLDIYKYDGYLPDARSGNSNGRTQGGSNAEVMIADAYVKGLKGIDYGLALNAMLKDAMYPPGGNEEKEGRGGLTDYNSLGYVSSRFVRSGTRTVEYAYNDFCLAQVAKGKGRMGEYQRFIKQSDNWTNLWRDTEDNGSRGFIMPKDPSGKWIDSIQCDVTEGRYNFVKYTPLTREWPICICWWCGFFYEGTSWEYSFYVPHDVPKLIEKSGGKEAFHKRLDTFFNNGYYNVGNEPSFLTSMLYHWIGRPDLSSNRIRTIINENYNSSRSGIPGNDDSGAMSSWLAFHMMGIYPNAGQPYYLITAPFLKETTLNLEDGKKFTIIAKNLSSENVHIKSAKLNGLPFNQAWIEHSDIVKGGKLIFEMTDKPSDWGSKIVPPTIN